MNKFVKEKYHYTYRIIHLISKKEYIGVRTCSINPEEDLGIKYFSSSTNKEFMLEQKECPENFEYKIISLHPTRSSALQEEIDLHAFFNVGINEKYYNKSKAVSTGFCMCGIKMSEQTKEKIKRTKNTIQENGKTIAQNSADLMSANRMTKIESNGLSAAKNIGRKSGDTQIKNGSQKGQNNARARKILILNENNDIMFESYGNLAQICKENNLPYGEILVSLLNNRKMYQTDKIITRITNNGNIKFKNWIAIYKDQYEI